MENDDNGQKEGGWLLPLTCYLTVFPRSIYPVITLHMLRPWPLSAYLFFLSHVLAACRYNRTSHSRGASEYKWPCNQGLSPVVMQTSSIPQKASLTCFLLTLRLCLALPFSFFLTTSFVLCLFPSPTVCPSPTAPYISFPVSQDLCRCHLCRSVLPETSAHGVNTDQQEVHGWDKGIRGRGYQYVNWEWTCCSASHCTALIQMLIWRCFFCLKAPIFSPQKNNNVSSKTLAVRR